MRTLPLAVSAVTVTSALGAGVAAHREALASRLGGLRRNDFTDVPLETWIGRVPGLESEQVPGTASALDCRNNRLAWLAMRQDGFLEAVASARERYGTDRIALIVGTSTGSIGATEEAYRRLAEAGTIPASLRAPVLHVAHSLGRFVQETLGLTGVCATVTTACSSSAKVFAQAERLIRVGLADAAIVGGVDTLCGSVLFGFNALELVSPGPCQPFDIARRGISIGEAGGFALLERGGEGPWLLGYGESSDAHHMSSPHPEGLGARLAIGAALATAGLAAPDVGYINLHGTASARNDEIEAVAVADLFPASTPAGSTKGWTGHTLGAAGFLEAVITLEALAAGCAPGMLTTADLDPSCGPQIRIGPTPIERPFALSNSFGFGGSNCVLAFGFEPRP